MAESATGTLGRSQHSGAMHSLEKDIPLSLAVSWLGSLTISGWLRNKYHLLERREFAAVAPSGKSACLRNKMCHELSGGTWQYLAPGSICQAAQQSASGCVAPRSVYIPARKAPRPWYMRMLPSCQPLPSPTGHLSLPGRPLGRCLTIPQHKS